MGRPSFSEAGRLEKKGRIITRPRDQETTNRCNENDGVSTLVHELSSSALVRIESTLALAARQ